jgi:hypothetical protein
MGTSLAMIDLHYGHLASDGRQHAVALLDALAREKLGTLGGHRRCERQTRLANRSDSHDAGSRQTAVDARWTSPTRRVAAEITKGGAEQGRSRAL